MKHPRLALGLAVLLAACGGGVYAALQVRARAVSAPLTSFAPPDALLAIEAPNFAALLKSWNSSAEQKRWLAGDNYAGFVRSRLYERLGQAQDEFATTAGLAADTSFLSRIAGGQSLLAWYDIGKLEFLYITRLPAGQAAKTPLLQLRDRFEQRKVGDAVFFVRTEEGKDGAAPRTVTFAVRGDLLLMATREDLLANALQLMQKPAGRTLEHDAWYAGTVAAAGPAHGDMRMTLNLEKIVPSPYFRSYWIQQNITEMKRYTAALCDLSRTPEGLVDRRVLLSADSGQVAATADLKPLQSLVPDGVGVYRITAQPGTAAVLDAIEDKLLTRGAGTFRDTGLAPVADLATPVTASDGDFERRIDEPLVVSQPRGQQMARLSELLDASPATAMLTFSTVAGLKPADARSGIFRAAHTAVAISGSTAWDEAALRRELVTVLSARLSVGSAGLAWVQHGNSADPWYTLSGAATLAVACRASVCVVASDEATLNLLLAAAQHAGGDAVVATESAGYRHGTERAAFEEIAQTLDHGTPAVPAVPGQEAPAGVPPFFSGNVASLGRTFQDVNEETFQETATSPGVTKQVMTYRWRR